VAWMWQHDETGMTGFVEDAPPEELAHWERMNKPRKIVTPLFRSSRATEPDRNAALTDFALWCIEELRGDNIGSDINGGDAQDKLVELGLLKEFAVEEPCVEEGCACAEYGDFPQECLRDSPGLSAAIATRTTTKD